MPVNSFDDYYMSWKPEREKLERPYYLSLAQQLERDIAEGLLRENTKLPPQRELADFLDLNLSTVTRAYKLCELKGLLYGVTGSGTFVSPGVHSEDTFLDKGSSQEKSSGRPSEKPLIEMGMIRPFYETDRIVLDTARTVMERGDACRLLEYSSPLGTDRQLLAARRWLHKLGVDAAGDNLMIVAGAQNALSVVLISLFQAGDKIAVDEYTYTNFKSLAHLLQIQLAAVECDGGGMRPEALLTLCRNSDIKGIYLMPTCSNPTGICIPQSRRAELAKVIREYGLLVIEDDIYSFLSGRFTVSRSGTGQTDLPWGEGISSHGPAFCPENRCFGENAYSEPFFSLLPENTIHICSTSKSLCAGLRVAFLAFPRQYREQLTAGMLSINLKTVSLNAEIIAELILSGEAGRIVEKKISLAQGRNRIFQKYFPGVKADIPRFFHWIQIPETLTGAEAELLALQKGIHILGSQRFAVGSQSPAAYVRLSVASPRSEAELEEALRVLQELLGQGVLVPDRRWEQRDFYC